MDQRKLAEKIYGIIGPAENVLNASNCMTRLRLRLVNKDEAMLACLKGVEGVLGINDTEDELQIILGPGRAAKVAAEFEALLQQNASVEKEAEPQDSRDATLQENGDSGKRATIGDGEALHEAFRAKNATPVKLLFRRIASIFIPLIPGFIACGLITGSIGVAAKVFPGIETYPLFRLLGVLGNAVFWGMNLFVGYNAAKVFDGTPILGGVLAALISHPGLSEVSFGDTSLTPGRGGVIAVVFVAAFGAWIEKRLHRLIPEMFDLFLTPLFTTLIAGAVAIFFLQPVGGVVSEAIGRGATGAVVSGGATVGFLMAGLWLPMVMLGIHQAITPIHVDLIARYGVTILLPILAMAGAGQVGASLAVYCRTKNSFLKRTIASALPVGIMGVGEPLIYGVTLPLGRPFVAACIGGACGGAVEAYFAVGAATLGISGLPLAGATDNIPAYLLGVAVAYAAGFIAAWLLGFQDPEESAVV
ncbi:MAG: PTS transporter subunit EIIC [Schwartzia sp.]|nr:PTS transporter subunit EIIC [Schwartzia sp. (in: firmicutes)]